MTLGPATEEALCRSALYEALALGFRLPTAETVERLVSREGAAGLRIAAARLDPDELAALGRRLGEVGAPPGELTEAYQRLFGHTVRSPAPAYETEYGADDLFRQPHEIADIAGFYAAFGLGLAPGVGERADHVSAECEFLMFLARREAVALEEGREPVVAEIRRSTRLFLRDHLARFLPSFVERLRRADPEGFYGALGAFGTAFVRRECAHLGLKPGRSTLALRLLIDDRVLMACGNCPEAAAADGD